MSCTMCNSAEPKKDAAAARPCYAHPIIAIPMTIPLGGMIGFGGALFGFIYYLQRGLSTLNDQLSVLNMTLPYTDLLLFWMQIGFIVANSLVCLYGWREKIRLCFGKLPHCDSCPGWFLKFWVKSLVHLIVCAALALVLVLMVIFVAIYVVFWTIDQLCGSSQSNDVVTVLQLIGASTSDATKICDASSDGMYSSGDATIGVMIMVVAQIIVLSYWMKYSTLAMVKPYWTTGAFAESQPIKESEIEAVLQPVTVEVKPPRKN